MKVIGKMTKALRDLRQRIEDCMARFAAWQRKVPDIPALRAVRTVCKNCGHTFDGNFCPRCGQSASESKFTFKHAIQKSLEVWGLGNRSLPRTLWHLIYRPGYMIGDYLAGRRMPFFPPVKMLFLIVTAHVVVSHAVSPSQNAAKHVFDKTRIISDIDVGDTGNAAYEGKYAFVNGMNDFVDGLNGVVAFFSDNMALEAMFTHSIFALVAVWVFRRSPARPGMTLTESFFSQIFIACQLMFLSLFSIVLTGSYDYMENMYNLPLPLLLAVLCYDYKQLFGFGVLRTIWKTAVVYFMWFFSIVLLAIASMLVTVAYNFIC